MSGVQVPDAPLSNQLLARTSQQYQQYPHWCLLERSEFVPVALQTSHVGNDVFDRMLHYVKLRAVPSWAETMVETIYRLNVLDSSREMNLITILWDACDPETPYPDPDSVYEECLFRVMMDFLEEEFIGTREEKIKFCTNYLCTWQT
jgi:hypothetical protein